MLHNLFLLLIFSSLDCSGQYLMSRASNMATSIHEGTSKKNSLADPPRPDKDPDPSLNIMRASDPTGPTEMDQHLTLN